MICSQAFHEEREDLLHTVCACTEFYQYYRNSIYVTIPMLVDWYITFGLTDGMDKLKKL